MHRHFVVPNGQYIFLCQTPRPNVTLSDMIITVMQGISKKNLYCMFKGYS